MGKAITPPEGLLGAATGAVPLPQATALAAATITAQLQTKEGDLVTSPILPGALGQVAYLNGTVAAPSTIL